MTPPDFALVKRRSDLAWQGRAGWNRLYEDAYRYCIPMRRPGPNAQLDPDYLFDMTAPASAMHFAGNLQRDLFPAGQKTFNLKSGPVARLGLGPKKADQLDRVLETMGNSIHPFFQAGDWDTATHEACLDLAIGTAAVMPVKGSAHDPVRFAAVPFDQIAMLVDVTGRPTFISWKQPVTAEQVLEMFPKGSFPDDFREKAKTSPNTECTLRQEFFPAGKGAFAGWWFVAYIENSLEFITAEWSRTQQIAVPRYYRVPGEAYGRGVILTALPSIKTVNKAQEIALKSAAISMLGIWGYRSGGTFNPDTSRIGPGEMWAMQATGGVLGPDVQRLDVPGGRMDVARMLIGNLQDQIREAMFDTRLPEYQGTPRAASEIAARLQQRTEVHIGAFGRLVRELMPVIVPRVAEILGEFRLLPDQNLKIDHLLVALEVQSPMAAALNAHRLASIANYIEFVGAVAGPEQVPLYAKLDAIMGEVRKGLQIDGDLVPNEDERKAIEGKMQEEKQAQILQLFGQEAAKQAPALIAKGMEQAA